MVNIETKITGNKLVITVDLSKRFGTSGSGKSVIVASTEGNQRLTDKHAGISFGLNVYESTKTKGQRVESGAAAE
jgi:hypothetical protein